MQSWNEFIYLTKFNKRMPYKILFKSVFFCAEKSLNNFTLFKGV
jgi:hypothetical protein